MGRVEHVTVKMASSSKDTGEKTPPGLSSATAKVKALLLKDDSNTKPWDPLKSPDFDNQSYSHDAIVRIKRFVVTSRVFVAHLQCTGNVRNVVCIFIHCDCITLCIEKFSIYQSQRKLGPV